MKKKVGGESEGDTDSQHSRGSTVGDSHPREKTETVSIKIPAPTVRQTLNLYEDEEDPEPFKGEKVGSMTSTDNRQGQAKESVVKSGPSVADKGKVVGEAKTTEKVKNKMQSILKSGNNFLSHLDDFF